MMLTPSWRDDPLARLRFRLRRMSVLDTVTLEELPGVTINKNDSNQFRLVADDQPAFKASGSFEYQIEEIVAEVARRLEGKESKRMVQQQTDGGTRESRILQALNGKTLTTSEITVAIGEPAARTNNILYYLRKLLESGEIVRSKTLKFGYCLPDSDDAVVVAAPPNETVADTPPVLTLDTTAIEQAARQPVASPPETCEDCDCTAKRVLEIVMQRVPQVRTFYESEIRRDQMLRELEQLLVGGTSDSS